MLRDIHFMGINSRRPLTTPRPSFSWTEIILNRNAVHFEEYSNSQFILFGKTSVHLTRSVERIVFELLILNTAACCRIMVRVLSEKYLNSTTGSHSFLLKGIKKHWSKAVANHAWFSSRINKAYSPTQISLQSRKNGLGDRGEYRRAKASEHMETGWQGLVPKRSPRNDETIGSDWIDWQFFVYSLYLQQIAKR